MATRRSRIPIAAIILLVATVACTRDDPPATAAQTLQARNGLSWYRGNLHAHTLWSDGDDFPGPVVERYRQLGHQFLALTEHDALAQGERWLLPGEHPGAARALQRLRPGSPVDAAVPVRLQRHDELASAHDTPGRFLLLQGEEISDAVGPVSVHLNAIHLPTLVQPARRDTVEATIVADIAAAAAAGRAAGQDVLVQLNHPNFTYSITAEHLMQLPGTAFFEVYNGHPLSNNPGDGLRPSTERLWDIALAWRLDVLGLPLLYGTATDDSHHSQPDGDAPPGRGWIEVLSDSLAPAALFEAMRKGRFYASTGVRLQRIVATDDRLEVDVDAEPGVDYVIEFIGTRRGFDAHAASPVSATGRPMYASHRYHDDIGRVFARHASRRATYRFHQDDLYVRARITATRAHPAPSQPRQFMQAWVQPVVGPAGRTPSRPTVRPPPPPPPSLHQGITRRFEAMRDGEAASLQAAARIPCAIDALGDGHGIAFPAYPARGSLSVNGWIADPGNGRVPGSFALVLDGARDYLVEDGPGRRRPDVAAHFDEAGLEQAGFQAAYELPGVAAGEYRIWVVGFDAGTPRACDSGKTVRVQ